MENIPEFLLGLIKESYRRGVVRRGHARYIKVIARVFPNVRWKLIELHGGIKVWLDLTEPSCIPFFLKPECSSGLAFFGVSASKWKCLFDVGANIGLVSICTASNNSNCSCVAFEPTPSVVDILQRNSLLYPNIKVVPNAVGVAEGKTLLYLSKSSVFNSTTRPQVKVRKTAEIQVPVLSLDTYTTESGCLPDIIKVDVEGGEFEVLQGARMLIQSSYPPVWFVEINTTFLEQRAISYCAIQELLKQNTPTEIDSYEWNTHSRTLKKIAVKTPFRGNVVYIPSERLPEYTDLIEG